MTISDAAKSCSIPGSSGDVILRTVGLTKNFGRIHAVKDMNLELRRGEVFGFLGPNGAGKSTTVGMILGLITPTAGKIELFGRDFNYHRWSALRRVGAVIEEPAFYPYLSGWDNLEALAIAIGGIPRSRIRDVLERVNLLDRARDKYSHYSVGMKQRLGIASTLLRDPELIMLDEPTNGLDPAGTKEIRDLIPNLAHENRCVFLCSHLLHEVEKICSRVAIIKNGVMLACSSLQELVSQKQEIQIRVEDTAKAIAVLKSLPWVNSTQEENGYVTIKAGNESPALINRALGENGIWVSELVPRAMSLEKVFLELTSEKNE